MPYADPTSAAAIESRRRVGKRQRLKVKNDPVALEKKRARDRKYAATHVAEAAARMAAWAPLNRAKLNANSAKYRQDNLEKVRACSRDFAKRDWPRVRDRKYGLAPGQFDEMVKAQGGVCKICGRAPDNIANHGALHVDHDHVTGAVRDLLCRACNFVIGQASESPEVLEAAAAYMRRHKG